MWFPFALIGALSQAAQFAVIKGRARHLPPLVLMTWSQAVSAAAWLLYFPLTRTSWGVPWSQLPGIALSVALANGMVFLLTRASGRGDISVVGPVLALAPVFAVLPDAALSGTMPGRLGWLGLALSVAGTMTLAGGTPGGFALRAFWRRRDALDALGAALLLGMLSAVDRWNALAIGVPRYLGTLYPGMMLVTLTIALARMPRALVALRARDAGTVVVHGLLGALGVGFQVTAMMSAPASYVSAVRRLSAILSVLLGRALFEETGIGERLLGAALTTAGAVCLVLAR